MNSIENVEAIIIPRVHSNNRQFTSVEDLKLKIIAEWCKIDEEILNNPFKSI